MATVSGAIEITIVTHDVTMGLIRPIHTVHNPIAHVMLKDTRAVLLTLELVCWTRTSNLQYQIHINYCVYNVTDGNNGPFF